jgi:hypothetical protein
MRVSSLSNEQVIRLIKGYFVPVWASRDAYQLSAGAKADQDELLRIDRSLQGSDLKSGNVCVYIVDPKGAVMDTQMVHQAAQPANLSAFLQRQIDKHRLRPRSADAIATTAAPPRTEHKPTITGGMMLHVMTRLEGNRADYGVSQDWVELTPKEVATFIPAADADVRASWTVPPKVAGKLARYFYPPGPNWRVKDSTVISARLQASIAALSETDARVNLRGTVEVSFPFGAEGTDGRLKARVIGFARSDPQRKVLTEFALVSEEAKYDWLWKGDPQPETMAIGVELER